MYALDEDTAGRAGAGPDRDPGGVRGVRRVLRRRARGGRAAALQARGDLAGPDAPSARCWPTCRAWPRPRARPRRASGWWPRRRRAAGRGAPTPWRARRAAPVAALEWLDPVFVGGHWVPQMIELAGGVDVLGLPGEKSRTVEWAEVEAARPERGGGDAVRLRHRRGPAQETARSPSGWPPWARAVVAVDAAAYFSRPGPRLVDGVELLAHLMHPDLVARAARDALARAGPARPRVKRAERSVEHRGAAPGVLRRAGGLRELPRVAERRAQRRGPGRGRRRPGGLPDRREGQEGAATCSTTTWTGPSA